MQRFLLLLLSSFLTWSLHGETLSLKAAPETGDFVLVGKDRAASFVVETSADPALVRATEDVRADIERVSGLKPELQRSLTPARNTIVLIGTLGSSPLIDTLVASGKAKLGDLSGAWESYVIETVDTPFLGVDQALLIVGSDRRGTLYGLYELSAAIGVSPWHWWADVKPRKQATLAFAAGTHRFGPPSVKYRGLFINDEDWGLQPWAAKTFEPEAGGIGPKTYAKVFELLLRLKANTLWPAMHACTKAFNAFPENAALADAYGIVLGSSHAEPMLRNNVREWSAPPATYNYLTNRDGVLAYWRERVAANGRFESIYTLGMRGIHDSSMQGPLTDAERVKAMESIFADQRELLARHVNKNVAQVPQMFCAYKEVLGLYRQGLRVPEDVTIVWPDDNFGYIRNFATPDERRRPGGFGVYYHVSYLGRPLSYLWLCTTPPALIWEEMRKAYDHGADRLWIVNVGDIKPAEIATDFFFQMAWDINRWNEKNLQRFLPEWSEKTFGSAQAEKIAGVMDGYYQLNFQRKPEHLQWWLPRQPRKPSDLNDPEVKDRLAAFAGLRTQAEDLRNKLPAEAQEAFYQLVYYPVIGSALANERFFEGEAGDLTASKAADERLKAETAYFNQTLSGGKWKGFMNLEPASEEWSSMRLEPWTPPASARAPKPAPEADSCLGVDAANFTTNTPQKGVQWTIIPGLGHSARAVTLLPFDAPTYPLVDATKAPCLEYTLQFPRSGDYSLSVQLLPTHPIAGKALSLAYAFDNEAPQLAECLDDDGGPAWAQGVLEARRAAKARLTVSKSGTHTLRLYGLQPGIVLDRLTLRVETATANNLHSTTKN